MVQFMEAGQCYLAKNSFRKLILRIDFIERGERGRYDVVFVDVVTGARYSCTSIRSTGSPCIEFDLANEEDFIFLNEHNRIL